MVDPGKLLLEKRRLVRALSLFIENYQKFNAGTSYAPEVNVAAKWMEEALLDLMRSEILSDEGTAALNSIPLVELNELFP